MIGALALALVPHGDVHVAASDWVTTGTDCSVFACADIDGDGRDDVLTINGAHQLCVAYSVRGEKAATWSVLSAAIPDGIVGLAFARTERSHEFQLFLATRDTLRALSFVDGAIQGDIRDTTSLLRARPLTALVQDAPSPTTSGTNAAENAAEKVEIEAVLASNGQLLVRTTKRGWLRLGVAASFLTPEPAAPAFRFEPVSPPPYELADSTGTKPLSMFEGDVNGDGRLDTLAVFAATLPFAHHVVRVALAPAMDSGDLDSDGLSDADEAQLGTDPLNRDTDGDGLLDGWEVHGVPCAMHDLDSALDPKHQDFIVFVSRYAQLDEAATKKELERSKKLYAELTNTNPDETRGVRLHYVWGPAVAVERQGNWPEVGEHELPLDARGIMHWMQVTPGGGGQSAENAYLGGSGLHWAAFAHELGHQLSLSHTGDSEPAWCPFYPSIMNYAFNYSYDGDGLKIRFSDGKRREFVLDERALHERMPVAFADVSYLAKGPFHFTIEPRGEHETWIDWNHDGRENEGLVSADINYGGSTYGGTRRDVGFTKTGPAMALVGGKITLAVVERDSGLVTLRTYLGDEHWSAARVVPGSETDSEPVIAGFGDETGVLFVKQARGWSWMRFDDTTIDAATSFDASTTSKHVGADASKKDTTSSVSDTMTFDTKRIDDLSACALDGGVLVVSRGVDGKFGMQFVAMIDDAQGKSLRWSDPAPLDFDSGVAVGIAYDAHSKEIVVAGSAPNEDKQERCFHVAWFRVDADHHLTKREERIVGGPHGVVHCTSRPVVRFTAEGQLVLFHTGWPDGNGSFTAYRTTQVANRALNDGWLVCLMYDIWTQTRVPVAFETDGTNAVYSYRWDASADRMNMLQVAHNGLGLDAAPMRDFDDAAKISKWGIRHSILNLNRP